MKGHQIIAFAEVLTDSSINENLKLALINDCLKDISKKAPYSEPIEFTFLQGEGNIQLPEDFRELSSLRLGLSRMSYKPPEDIPGLGEESNYPLYYFLSKGRLFINTVPTDEIKLQAVIKKGYSPLTSLQDEPGIPDPTTISYYIAWKTCTDDPLVSVVTTRERINSFKDEYDRRILQMTVDEEVEYISTRDQLPKRKPRGR